MENFSIAVNAVMPLLLFMLIGQGLLRAKLLDGTTYQKLNNAIFRIILVPKTVELMLVLRDNFPDIKM